MADEEVHVEDEIHGEEAEEEEGGEEAPYLAFDDEVMVKVEFVGVQEIHGAERCCEECGCEVDS